MPPVFPRDRWCRAARRGGQSPGVALVVPALLAGGERDAEKTAACRYASVVSSASSQTTMTSLPQREKPGNPGGAWLFARTNTPDCAVRLLRATSSSASAFAIVHPASCFVLQLGSQRAKESAVGVSTSDSREWYVSLVSELISVARELAEATRGIDWDAAKADRSVRRLLVLRSEASIDELDASLSVLVERLAASRLDDADGVAHVAITGGSLVEAGAAPRALADVLLHKLPLVLTAAREFANACLCEIADSEAEEVDDSIVEVDGVRISRALFRAKLPSDRAGGCALAYLNGWVLPAIAAWTRDRDVLVRAVGDTHLVDAAAAMRQSDAYFVDCLLGVELRAKWLVALPLLGRVFDIHVDGIVRNWDAHALLADALDAEGVQVISNSSDVLDALRAEHPSEPGACVRGTWNMYSHRASRFDLACGADVPLDAWVWGEGAPRDIPTFAGRRALLLGPPSVERVWNAGRVFSELPASVRVERELPAHEAHRVLREMRDHRDE